MKKLRTKMIGVLMLLVIPIYFYSCSSDDEKSGPKVLLPKAEGFYIYGTNTVAESPSEANARMALAILDHGKDPFVASQAGVYGKFMYIGANSEISFANVDADGNGTIYGAVDGGDIDNGKDLGYSVDGSIVHGDLAEGEDAIAVVEEGLYYAFANVNTGLFILMPVKPNIIGDAPLNDWSTQGNALALKSTSATETIFEGTNIPVGAEKGYRYRLNNGWHVYFEEDVLHTLSSLGVEEVWVDAIAKPSNDLGFFLENAPNRVSGVYTVQLKFTASTGVWSETFTKTGDLLVDYSAYEIGFFGNAYYKENGDPGDWTDPYEVKAPTKAGSVYTWTWDDVELIEGNEFVVLRDGAWSGGTSFLWNGGTTRAGAAFTNNDIIQGTGSENFHVATGGVYDITLVIDAAADTRTLTIALD